MNMSNNVAAAALDSRLRRLAKRQGYALCKSRRHGQDFRGGYRIVDPFHNAIVAGEKFDLSPVDVEAWLLS